MARLYSFLTFASSLALASFSTVTSTKAGELVFMVAADDGGVRRVQVIQDGTDMKAKPNANAERVVVLQALTRLKNRGCTATEAEIWCEVASIDSTAKGFVRASDLEAATGPDGTIPYGIDDSRKRARTTAFDQSGDILCAQNSGEKLGKCHVGVARSGGGDATAVVTFQNKFSRELYFTDGTFIRANATMSGVGRDTASTVTNDTFLIRVDDQRFEIPVEFIIGN